MISPRKKTNTKKVAVSARKRALLRVIKKRGHVVKSTRKTAVAPSKNKIKLQAIIKKKVKVVDIISPARTTQTRVTSVPTSVFLLGSGKPLFLLSAPRNGETARIVSPFVRVLFSRPMRKFAMRVVALALIVGLNLTGLNAIGTTVAYYNDVENSNGNLYQAGSVDFTLTNTPYSLPQTAINLSQGAVASTTVKVIPEVTSNPFWYQASSTNFGIDLDFCQTLTITSFLEGSQNYSGLLSNLLSPATTTLDDWRFNVSTNVNSYNKVCTFDFAYRAWQERHNLPEFDKMGFNDEEKVSNRVASKGFRINKVYYDVDEGEATSTPKSCDARSKGYFANNEGCHGGTGSANWKTQVNALSATYSGVFGATTGPGMCADLWTPNCPSGNTVAANLCKAKTHILADEMNVVSGRLDPSAIISGADDGTSAFDNLGLSPLSTVSQALAVLEAILADGSSTIAELKDAAYVGQRIYDFYETQNPNAPYCAYPLTQDPQPSRGEEGKNEWVEVYNQTNVPLDISGWKICDNTSCDTIPAGTPLVPSLGFAWITNDPGTASSTAPAPWYLPAGVVYIALNQNIGNGLANDADMLVLKRPDGVIVDQMNWGTPDAGWANYNAGVWNPGATDVDEGNVLARVPTGYDTDQASDWKELEPPSLDLIYPDETGTYTWYWGYSYNIKWTATNNNGPSSALKMSLYYIKDMNHDNVLSTGDTTHTITASTTNDGSHIWAVPDGFTGYIWIKIVATAPENPLLNTMGFSGSIYDPVPLYVGPYGIDPKDLDLEPPTISLNGNNPALIAMGSEYSDLGALVTDNVNDNLGYQTAGEVDTETLGRYTVTYTATDQMGNTGTATRLVIVYDPALGEPDLSIVAGTESELAGETSTTTEEVLLNEEGEEIATAESAETASAETDASATGVEETDGLDTGMSQSTTTTTEETDILGGASATTTGATVGTSTIPSLVEAAGFENETASSTEETNATTTIVEEETGTSTIPSLFEAAGFGNETASSTDESATSTTVADEASTDETDVTSTTEETVPVETIVNGETEESTPAETIEDPAISEPAIEEEVVVVPEAVEEETAPTTDATQTTDSPDTEDKKIEEVVTVNIPEATETI